MSEYEELFEDTEDYEDLLDKLTEDMSGVIPTSGSREAELLSKCPYNCTKGRVFLPKLGEYQDCPHCGEIYKKISMGRLRDENGEDIYKILRIPPSYFNKHYSEKELFPSTIKENTTEESRSGIIESLGEIKNSIALRKGLKKDYLFFIGVETDLLPYVFDTLRDAYAKGYKALPYINTVELIQLFKKAEEPENYDTNKYGDIEQELGCNYMDYCRAEVVFISIPPSAGRSSISSVLSLIKARRKRDLHTVVISETQGISRELGYILNSLDIQKCFIEKKQVETSSERQLSAPEKQGYVKSRENNQYQVPNSRKRNLGLEEEEETKVNVYKKL